MSTYSIKTISDSYKMTAFGVSFEDFNDWAGNAAKTAARKAEIIKNGKLAELLTLADGQEYQINHIIDGKAWRGFGVMGEFDVEGAVVLQFFAGDYLVVPGTGADKDRLADEITAKVFGSMLNEITDYQYIGPGNSTFVKAAENGEYYGEMWLRAQKSRSLNSKLEERSTCMADYTLEHKKSFVLTAYGFSIQSNFQDVSALQKEKAAFWNGLKADGRLDKLKNAAKDDREWSVNEVYQGKPWNYFAVEARKLVADATRIIEFPESEYIVVAGNGGKETLFDQLTYRAFGEVLAQITDYAYIGGPNATYREDNGDGTFYGEFWVPVVKK